MMEIYRWHHPDLATWRGTFDVFVELINNFHPTIKFMAEWSRRSVAFLDVNIVLKEGCNMTDLYTKSTDTHEYLNEHSCHPDHCKSSILYSQALKLPCICSEESNCSQSIKDLQHLVNRGYDRTKVRHQIDRATGVTRTQALKPNNDKRKKMDRFHWWSSTTLPYQAWAKSLMNMSRSYMSQNKWGRQCQKLSWCLANQRVCNLWNLSVRALMKRPKQIWEGSS